MSDKRTLDLGQDDVHQDGALVVPKKVAASVMPAKKRNRLPDSSFADSKNRKYPVSDKAHADNAAARLEQQKGSMDPSEYRRIKRRIQAAQRRFGESPKKGARMRAGYGFQLSIVHPRKGTITVRQMSEDVHCPTVELATLSDGERAAIPVWNQIAKPGRFFKDGSWFTMDQQTFQDVIRNFNASSNRQVAVDFEHASEMRGSEGTIPVLGAPAQGWIRQLEMRGQDLYGLVEWNDLARQYIRNKQYKYLSPAVRFGCKSPTTAEPIGARLTSAALTNTPFLDGMQQVAAKDDNDSNQKGPHMATEVLSDNNGPETQFELKSSGAMCYSAAEYMPQVRNCLRLSEIATAKQCKEHVGMLREHLKACRGNLSASPTGVRLADYMMPMRELVKPPIGATFDDMLDVVDEMIEHAIEEHEAAYHGVPDEEEEMSDASRAATLAQSLRDHVAGADPGTPAPATPKPKEATAMTVQATDKTAAELAVLLTSKESALKEAETEKMRLMAEAKESGAQLLAKDTEIKTLSDKVAELTQQVAKQQNESLEKEVDAAILSYKDSKGIKETDKPELLKFLQNAPEVFRKQYPAVSPARAHLMRDIATGNAGPGANGGGTRLMSSSTVTEVPDIKTISEKYRREDPNMSLEDSISKAFSVVNTATGNTH